MSKKTRHKVMYIFGGIALMLSAALIAAVMPDLRRYRRMCNM